MDFCTNHFSTTRIITDDNIGQKSIICETHLKNHLQIVENHMKTIDDILFTNE